MGVDYRAFAGYGISVNEEELQRAAEWSGYENEWGDFDGWEFSESLISEFPHLTFEVGGNFMSGDNICYLFVVGRSSHSFDFNYYSGDAGATKLGEFVLNRVEAEQLEALAQKIYGEDIEGAYIGWLLSGYVG